MALLNQLPAVRKTHDFRVMPELKGFTSFSDRWCVLISCLVVALVGAIAALSNRYSMGPDGISYLDISDVIRRGDWIHAINAYWGPLYPVALAVVFSVVKPTPYWEFPAAQLTNFLIYLGALGSFSFLLKTFIDHVDYFAREAKVSHPLPEWLWVIFGYTSFAWCSVQLIGVEHVNPDMLLSIFLYLAAAILLRIRMGSVRWQTYCLLGIVLGVGYLVKSPMFPLGIAFVVASVFAAGNLRRGLKLGLAAAALFLVISGPFIYQISKATGHLTFGDNALINYTSNVNRLPKYYWRKSADDPLSSRTYPAKQIYAYPTVFEFTMPLRGTYVYWYNPAEWYRGTKAKFGLRDNTRQLMANLYRHYMLFFHMIPVATMTILALMIFNRSRGRSVLADLRREWIVLAVPVFGLTMYTLVYFEYRHVGSLILLLLLGLFGSICLPDSRDARLGTSAIVLALSIMMAFQLLMSALAGVGSLRLADFSDKGTRAGNIQWQIADDLHQAGVKAGDKVAWLRPDHFDPVDNYWWARLGRFQIVAEIPDNAVFWSVDESARSGAIQSLSRAGVRALVVSSVPSNVKLSDFVKLGSTGYYVYLFPSAPQQPSKSGSGNQGR